MVSLLPTIIIFIVAVIAAISSASSGFTISVFVVSGIAAIITVLWTLSTVNEVIESKNKIKEAIRNIKIAKKRFEEIKELILENVKKFPLEAKLLEKLKSNELWEIPQIQSHGFLNKQINTLVDERKEIFNLLEKINSERREVENRKELAQLKILFLPFSIFHDAISDQEYEKILKEVGIPEDKK